MAVKKIGRASYRLIAKKKISSSTYFFLLPVQIRAVRHGMVRCKKGRLRSVRANTLLFNCCKLAFSRLGKGAEGVHFFQIKYLLGGTLPPSQVSVRETERDSTKVIFAISLHAQCRRCSLTPEMKRPISFFLKALPPFHILRGNCSSNRN